MNAPLIINNVNVGHIDFLLNDNGNGINFSSIRVQTFDLNLVLTALLSPNQYSTNQNRFDVEQLPIETINLLLDFLGKVKLKLS